MSTYRFAVHVAAPRDRVFDLWIDLDRMKEWIGGVTKVTDVTGPVDSAGTRYTVWFGGMRSRTDVPGADRPRFIRTRFGTWLLRGETSATFEAEGGIRKAGFAAATLWVLDANERARCFYEAAGWRTEGAIPLDWESWSSCWW